MPLARSGRSSEKLRDRIEQLELTLADINEMLADTNAAPSRAFARDVGVLSSVAVHSS